MRIDFWKVSLKREKSSKILKRDLPIYMYSKFNIRFFDPIGDGGINYLFWFFWYPKVHILILPDLV